MSQTALEKRVAALEQQVGDLLAQQHGSGRIKDWRRTRGAFTGDQLMQQVFQSGRKFRDAERKLVQPRKTKKRPTQP
jgi:hypothetical protein